MIIEAVLEEGRKMLSDTESKAILNAFHIPCTPTLEARTSTEALVLAEVAGFSCSDEGQFSTDFSQV